MRTVNIADLKDHLSHYLGEVREGEELVVRHRRTPIARIVPLAAARDVEADELALVAAGQLRLPDARLPSSFWSMPAPRVPVKRALEALAVERQEG